MAPPIPASELDAYLVSHSIDPAALRSDNFERFMAERREQLLDLIERAMGKSVYRDSTESAATPFDDGEQEAVDGDVTEMALAAE